MNNINDVRTIDAFKNMSSEEKEALFIWLNKDTMPQA